jgi:ABC-type cobalamin/Fe3+-siderophores transport system ATPase subunit
VSLQVTSGEFVVVCGPNGCGKTTLLKTINGLVSVSRGQVKIFGTLVTRKNGFKIRKKIAYLRQSGKISSQAPFTVEEVVSFARMGRGGFFTRITNNERELINNIIYKLGISHLSKRPIGHLSGGEQKKVAIARVLAQEADILLLDEPFKDLDIKGQLTTLELLKKVNQEYQITVVIVMHYLDFLPVDCSRFVFLNQARIMLEQSREQLLQENHLSRVYGCNLRVFQDNWGIVIRPYDNVNYGDF